jgi:hypothetical protein
MGALMSSGKTCHKQLALTSSLWPLGTVLSGVREAQVPPFMAWQHPAWAALSGQAPKPAGSRPALAARGLDGDSACQATICVAMSWEESESVHFMILRE